MTQRVTELVSDTPFPGVHRIAVPTPFAVGRVNCYLLDGEPLTLLDTGPNSGTALDHLERGLAGFGVRVEDLELIVLSHQHMDHEGLLEILARRSGAEVAAFAPLAPWLAQYREHTRADDLYAQAIMRRHGIPDETTTLLGLLTAGLHSYGSAGTVSLPLTEGDTLRMGGRDYTVLHRPGHSPSDIVLFDEQAGLLLGGDHLLSHISSNALVTRPLDAASGPAQPTAPADAPGRPTGPRPTPLVHYARSLRSTAQLPVSLLLTGHGEPVTDHHALIDARLRDQRRRARKILSMITGEPLTAHAIAQRMWGEIAITQAYLTLSEVLGHLDLLLAEQAAHEHDENGVSSFRAA